MDVYLTPAHRRRPVPEGHPDSTTTDEATANRSQTAARSIVVIGAGGHGRELADIVRQISDVDEGLALLGIVDDGTPDRLTLARGRFRFLGTTDGVLERDIELYIGIGDSHVRSAVDERLGGLNFAALVHPSAKVGAGTTLGDGVVLAQESVLTTNVRLARHTHVNVGATISHDCVIGEYVTVCPGVTLTGNVTIGDRVFLGAGATVIPGVTIGEGAVVGAGSTVIADVPARSVVAGSPARPI